MNEQIYNLARQAEQQAREYVRECEIYGDSMSEGNFDFRLYQKAEDEFHAEFRNQFAESIVRECISCVALVGLSNAEDEQVSLVVDKCIEQIKRRFGVNGE